MSYIHTCIQSGIQTDWQTERGRQQSDQTDQADQTYRHTGRDTYMQTGRLSDIQRDIQKGRQTG